MRKIISSAWFITAALSLFIHAEAAVKPAIQADFDGTPGPGKLTGKAEYVPGISGKAIRLADATVSFAPTKKMSPAEGSATLWVKPVNWKWQTPMFIFFLANKLGPGSKTCQMLLEKYHLKLGLLFQYGHAGVKSKTTIYANYGWDHFENDRWYALGMTWSKRDKLIRLYVDGKSVASARITDEMIPAQWGDFVLNEKPFRPHDRNHATDFDLLRLYDRALTESEMLAAYQAEQELSLRFQADELRKSFFRLPKLKQVPSIDGNMDEAEWKGAAKLIGFTTIGNSLFKDQPPTEVYAACDDKNLYFCFLSTIPDATRVVAKCTKRDSEVYYDDSVEVHLRHEKMGPGEDFQGIFNAKSVIYDARSGRKEWNGAWKVKTSIYEGLLTTEIAIPFSELENCFRDGSVWECHFARARRIGPKVEFTTLSPVGSNLFQQYGRFELSQGCFARMFINREAWQKRQLNLNVEIRNPSDCPVEVEFKTELRAPGGETIREKTESKTVAAGSSAFFSCEDPLTGIRAANIRITARENGSGKPILQQDLPFAFKDELRIEENMDRRFRMDVVVDRSSHFTAAKSERIVLSLLDGKGKGITRTEMSKEMKSSARLDFSALEPGDYVLKFDFFDANGKLLLSTSKSYVHIGNPRWLTEKPGADAGVIWPYTPIKGGLSEFSVLLRKYQFGNRMLPKQIIANGTPLFSAPPALKVKLNGKVCAADDLKMKTTRVRDDRVDMEFSGTVGNDRLKLSGKVTLEYDGFLWYSLDLSPLGKGPVTIERAVLEFPFAPGIGESVYLHNFKRDNIAEKIGDKPKSYANYPSLWIGNLDVGFAFMTESFRYWSNPGKECYHVRKTGSGRTLEVSLIGKTVKLGSPVHYEFGLHSNPVKPLPKQFRSWRLFPFKPWTIMHPWQIDKKIKKYPGWPGFYTPIHTSMEDFRREVKRFTDQGAIFTLYVNPLLVSPDSTEYKIFWRDWENPYNGYPECPNSSFTDFTVWYVAQHIKYGNLTSVYVDSMGAVNCYNPRHGCGYRDEKGEVCLTYPIRGMRNYMKRLYSLLHADGRDHRKNLLWAHTSARNCLAFSAFLDFQCAGEEVEYVMMTEPNYLLVYPLEQFQILFNKSTGTVPMMGTVLGRCGPKEWRYVPQYNDQIMQLSLLHDTLVWGNICDANYLSKKYYSVLDAFGYRDEALEFFRYQTQKLILCREPDIHISVYRLRDKALAVIGNWQNKPRTVKVEIDRKALGLGDQLKFSDLCTGKPVDPAAVKLQGFNFILMEIRQSK
ncbi:MAG: hypothetical protein J5806_01340 [Lentisphaeria bacterium]|nr:hypothetical protein [Lentisphaeria bacterium]